MAAADRLDTVRHAPLPDVDLGLETAVDPEEQLVVTLQLYKEEVVRPVKLADVPVCAVEKLSQVDEVFNL